MRIAMVLGLMLAGSQVGAETVERSTPADARGEVSISNISGSVRVEGWDRAEVQLRAELGEDVEELEFERDGNEVNIEVVLPKPMNKSNWDRYDASSADLVVRVPRDSAVFIHSISAKQVVKGVRGVQRLQSVSGSIDTEIWTGELDAHTVSGAIGIQGNDGRAAVRVNSVTGRINLRGSGQDLELGTINGKIDVEVKELKDARFNTVNGQLQVDGRLAPDARVEAEAINGSLEFRLQGDINAQFDVSTFNGIISNCFGPESQRSRKHGPGNAWRHTEGKGTARVRLKTLNGRVEICDRRVEVRRDRDVGSSERLASRAVAGSKSTTWKWKRAKWL